MMRSQQKNKEKGFFLVHLLVAIAMILVISAIGYNVYRYLEKSNSFTAQEGNPIKTQADDNSDTEWSQYSIEDAPVSFSYPENWGEIKVENNKEKSSARSYNGDYYSLSFPSSHPDVELEELTNEHKGYVASLDYEYTGGGMGGSWWVPAGYLPADSFENYLSRTNRMSSIEQDDEVLDEGPGYRVYGSIEQCYLFDGAVLVADIDLGDSFILRMVYIYHSDEVECQMYKDEGSTDDINHLTASDILPQRMIDEYIKFAKNNAAAE